MNELYIQKLISLISTGLIKEDDIKVEAYKIEVHDRLNPQPDTENTL
jgi:hypothetical protein